MDQMEAADDHVRENLYRSEAILRLLAVQLPALVMRITLVVGAEQVQPEKPPEWYLDKTRRCWCAATSRSWSRR